MDSYLIAPGDAGRRVDVFLTETGAGLTRSACQRYLETGAVRVDGRPVAKNYRLRAGDALTVAVAPPAPYVAAAENIPLDVVYEDGDIIVINKPRGLVVHPGAGHFTGTLVNALLYHCGGSLSGINGVMRPGIVHRLDKDTSGLLVAAKHDGAHQGLAAQWDGHAVRRVYHALCLRVIDADALTIDQPIARHPVDRKRMAVAPASPRARRAVTHIQVLARYARFTLAEARLETGRTHQIRVHMAHIGHPVAGDGVYGPKKQPFGLEGQVLHAKTLSFLHPVSRQPLCFDTACPAYFNAAVAKACV